MSVCVCARVHVRVHRLGVPPSGETVITHYVGTKITSTGRSSVRHRGARLRARRQTCACTCTLHHTSHHLGILRFPVLPGFLGAHRERVRQGPKRPRGGQRWYCALESSVDPTPTRRIERQFRLPLKSFANKSPPTPNLSYLGGRRHPFLFFLNST